MMLTRRKLLMTAANCALAGGVIVAQTGKPHDDINQLPKNLPVPVDDGACKHLPGLAVPPIALRSTRNRMVNLAEIASPRTLVYCYPRTGQAGQEPPPGWNEIPGARGCTPESCGFRDRHKELQSLHVAVFGLSSQTTEYQQEMVARLHLPFEVLSDANFAFTNALRLPTWKFDGVRLLKRLTLVISGGKIEKVFYPVFPPDQHAKEVVDWLTAHPVG
jgi:peroxiredoxin